MKVTYNSPVVLTLFIVCGLIVLSKYVIGPDLLFDFFSTDGELRMWSPLFYFNLFSHILGHSSLKHFTSNFMIILLVGPLLEKKIGSKDLLIMILITAVATGLLNTIFFRVGILGASGIACMMLILASCGTMQRGELPLTLIVAALLFFSEEAVQSLRDDRVSQFAHILGGLFGGVFGLFWHPQPPNGTVSKTI